MDYPPEEHMKAGVPDRVPLTPWAVTLLISLAPSPRPRLRAPQAQPAGVEHHRTDADAPHGPKALHRAQLSLQLSQQVRRMHPFASRGVSVQRTHLSDSSFKGDGVSNWPTDKAWIHGQRAAYASLFIPAYGAPLAAQAYPA